MHVVAVAAWRQMHTHSLGSPNGDHRIGDFKHEPSAVLDRIHRIRPCDDWNRPEETGR
jgi:hypothetical protein